MLPISVLSRRTIRHPLSGGAGQYIHEIFRRLTDSYEITVMGEGSKDSAALEEVDGIRYVNLRGPFQRLRIPLTYMSKYLRRSRILVDHSDVAIPWFSPLFFASKPTVVIVHQIVKEIYYYQLSRPWAEVGAHAEKSIYKLYSNSRIVSSSKSAADELVEFGIPQENISVIAPGYVKYPGVRLPFEKRPKTVACVSRLVRYKGIQFALVAFRDVLRSHPDATFRIAGSGTYEKSLRQFANRLGISPSVEFLGRVTQEAKFDLLSNSRAVVFPSVRDGFGISVIEANSVGTPVVAWDVPGPRDSIVNHMTGLLSPFPDEQAFASNLTTLLGNGKTWERMSDKAWKTSHNYSWDSAAKEFRLVLDSLVATTG